MEAKRITRVEIKNNSKAKDPTGKGRPLAEALYRLPSVNGDRMKTYAFVIGSRAIKLKIVSRISIPNHPNPSLPNPLHHGALREVTQVARPRRRL